ncbi:hypothetical protein [Roseomonas sp. KE0001]|uniref:hypothetical protein n=1 Tax=Roseomonas sp. KE0001 TaxID=2479201 RepID=UPI0018DF4A3D|nr:hypothetical protein [Roseomonas sp. KE0001]MBI0434009.1 hypothetical protein [Roseomonas sp. KE0001]
MIRPSRAQMALAYVANGDLPPLSILHRPADPVPAGDRGLRIFAYAMAALAAGLGTWAGAI